MKYLLDTNICIYLLKDTYPAIKKKLFSLPPSSVFLSAVTVAGKIRGDIEKKGTPIGPYDLQIAAQGVSRNLTVVTHNTDEFSRVENLQIEDWTKE